MAQTGWIINVRLVDVENYEPAKCEEKIDPGIAESENLFTDGAMPGVLRKHQHSPRMIKYDETCRDGAAKLNAIKLAANRESDQLHCPSCFITDCG